MQHVVFNHVSAKLSEVDMSMIRCVPPGGNWRNIDPSIPSKRLEQIRLGVKGGSRSTYYGRLTWDKPSYTISTLFNRPGNGCYIHPEQQRLISQREAARLQSFPDRYRFYGSKTSIYKQVGNAVPPLLGYAVGKQVPSGEAVDLFCGAGGLGLGIELAGHKIILGADIEEDYVKTYKENRDESVSTIIGDLTNKHVLDKINDFARSKLGRKRLNLLVGGPPCQGFSEAGNKRSVDDPRNSLFKAFVKAIQLLRPRFFAMEQIPSVRTLEQGRFFEMILNEFRSLNEYGVAWTLLRAEEFGVPQLRRRIFVFGSSEGKLVPPTPIRGPLLASHVTVRDAISDLPVITAGGGDDLISYDLSENLSSYAKWAVGKISIEETMKEVLNPPEVA
jgi:DNA (cytosine-5)-methyltransferase 1